MSKYHYIKAPLWYTGWVTPQGYAKEHLINYCLAHGLTEVPKGYHIHHIDENKFNNDPSNLMMLTHSEHIRLHMHGENNPMFGKHHSEEAKRKMSEALKGNHNASTKSVYCIELNTVFVSVSEAERQTGVLNSNICKCCRGELKTAGKLHWCYADSSTNTTEQTSLF